MIVLFDADDLVASPELRHFYANHGPDTIMIMAWTDPARVGETMQALSEVGIGSATYRALMLPERSEWRAAENARSEACVGLFREKTVQALLEAEPGLDFVYERGHAMTDAYTALGASVMSLGQR